MSGGPEQSSASAGRPVSSGRVADKPGLAVLRGIFLRFWPLTKPFRGRIYLSLVLVVAAPAVSTAEIGMFKTLIDRILVPHDFRLFPLIALFYLGLTLLQGLVSFVDQYLGTWIGEKFVLNLRTQVFSHLHRLSSGFFDNRQLGDLLSRLTGDTGAIETLVLSGVAQGLTYAVKLVLYTGAMFYVDWRLASASLVAAPGFLLVARVFSRRIKVASRENRVRVAAITSVAEESFSNASLVRAYGRAEDENARFDRQNQAVFAAQMVATRLQALFGPLTEVVETLGVLAVIGLAIWELAAGRVTIGGLLVFMAYLAQLYTPIQGLSSLMNSLYSASAGAERVLELLEEKPSITDPLEISPRTAVRLDRARGTVRLTGVRFAYPGATTPTLSGIDIAIRPGQTIALVGASGAGKSTLAKLLLRFYDPDAGSISLDGIELRSLALADLYRNIATVLQETLVFDGTVRDNILWGRPEATDDDIIAAATAADAHEFITGLPQGYDTPIGQRGRKLSGGQRQRLAIARAMIRDAPVLLLDEPTTGLDAEATHRVLAPLRRLMAGRTTILISHNLHTVTDADAIVYLEHGRIAGTGPHSQLLRDCSGYRELYRLHHPSTEPEPATARPQKPPITAKIGPLAGREAAPAGIEFIRVRHRYRDHRHDSLPELSFRLPAGDCVAITGPSGVGKTTLLQLLVRQLAPTGGTIRILGRDLARLDPHWLRQRIAFVPEDPYVPVPEPAMPSRHDTSQETVLLDRLDLLGRPSRSATMAAVPTSRDALYPPPGAADAVLDDPLSRRRAAIHRALRTQPDVLLLDNPTHGLDPYQRTELLDVLRRLAKQHTMIITTQDPVVRAFADHVIDLTASGDVRQARSVPGTGDTPRRQGMSGASGVPQHRVHRQPDRGAITRGE